MAGRLKKTRRESGIERRDRFWQARIANAETSQDRAAVEWNWLRAEVQKLPRGREQAAAWEAIRRALKTALDEIRENQQQIADRVAPEPSSRRPSPRPSRALGFMADVAAGRR